MPRLAAVLLAVAIGGGTVLAQDSKFFRIGTGPAGGTYFPIGGIIANAISNPPGSRPCDRGGSCGVPGLLAVAQSTQGSVANILAMQNGTLESGLVQADIAFWAFTGEKNLHIVDKIGNKPERFSKLRAIASLYPETIHIVVRKDAKITSIEDLKGKRVSLGEKESGSRIDAEIVLGAYGLSTKSLKAVYLNPGQAADMMHAGELDAFFFTAGYPAAAITDLAETEDLALLPIVGKQSEALRKRYPFFFQRSIPGDVYRGVDATPTLAVSAQWLVSADVNEELVYQITKALWHENTRRLLDQGHREARSIRLDTALDGLAIPLHPGAERYYREMGRIAQTVPASQ
ncbi:MAG: TAXI family TRAP transporter solute-binding subunit [Candidatus Eiseniibacteriota bacterium]